MIENWKDVQIVPEFCDQGVDCYRLEGGHFLNEYYIVSEAETRKLMNHPEVVGYEVYASLVTATSQMMYYLKEKKKITSANILSILRGALNYPLEESCYKEHIRVHDISFMSSERVFENGEMTGLEIKYCKLATVPNSTLLIGDIIASGETLVNCLRYVIDYYRKRGAKLRNTIVSYIAVPMVAVLGTVAMILAVMRGDGTIVDQFAKSSGTLTVIGGAGLVVGSFVSGGTATPNFSRFAKSGKVGAITTVIAFFIGNSLMFFFGGVSSVYVGGNDIFEVMINLGLFYLAILVLGLNIWTTNDNALYSAGLGLANIFGQKKKPMVLVSGIIGTVLAVWLYWNFCGWLNILNCTLPPVGIILVLGYFLNKEKYQDVEVSETVNWFAVIGVVLGAVVANLVHWGIASINGMVVAAVCYLIGRAVEKK